MRQQKRQRKQTQAANYRRSEPAGWPEHRKSTVWNTHSARSLGWRHHRARVNNNTLQVALLAEPLVLLIPRGPLEHPIVVVYYLGNFPVKEHLLLSRSDRAGDGEAADDFNVVTWEVGRADGARFEKKTEFGLDATGGGQGKSEPQTHQPT